jgi:predicted phosphodiesterase
MLDKMSFYCQPILPLVYDESMSYYEKLCKVVGHLNTAGDAVNKLNEGLTGEIADRQAADAALSASLKVIEDTNKKIHFLVFDGANPNGGFPTRHELYQWVEAGDAIFTLLRTYEEGRGQIYAASCSYNAGNWGSEASNDFSIIVPLETTYDSTGKLAVKQKIVKLTIPSYTKKNLNVPWGEEIIEINTPHTSAEGVVNFTATVVGETVTANITPADFIRLFDAASVTSKLCVGVNARLNYNALELGSSVATVYDNSSAKREVRITFVQDPHAGRRGYVPSEIFDLVNIVGDKDANTWKVETFGTELFDFQRYEGFQFTRKTGNVIEAAEDCDPESVAQYYNDLPGKDYQNLPVHLIDEVENADYWNGTFDSYSDGHITFTFTTANYAAIGEKMSVRVIELSAARTGEEWVGNEKWSYAAKEFDIPYRPTSYLLDVWKANETPTIDGGLVSYEGESTLDFDDILPLVQGNQNLVATLHNGTSESGPELSGLIYSKMNVANGIGSITFATTEGVSLNNGIPSMTGIVVFSKDSAGAKKVTITFSSSLPVPSADGTDNGKVPIINGTTWELKTPTVAQEQLTGTTHNLTPTQVYEAVSAGTPVKVQYTDSTYGLLSFTAFNVAETLNTVVSQTIVYYNGVYILAELYGNKTDNRWYFIATTLAQKSDIPSALPNPNALTITSGSNSVTYDGRTAESIDIPSLTAPDYVLAAADAVAENVNSHISGSNILFAVMSDAHLGVYTDTENAAGKQAGQALERINDRISLDFVVHAGDYTTGAYNTTASDAIKDDLDYQLLIGSKFKNKNVWCIGNHDDAPYQSTANRLTKQQIYATISRKNLASNGYVTSDNTYGYMDFEALHLRAIYLDTQDRYGWGSNKVGAGGDCPYRDVENISAEQLSYLVNTMLNFNDKPDSSLWSILVFSHAALNTSGTYTSPDGVVHPCNTSNAAAILSAYSRKKSGSINQNGTTVNYDFTAINPAEVIACIHGHEHRYSNETVGTGILSIGCPNIMNGRERVSSDGKTYSKTPGTANGTSFCVFAVNRDAKTIYAGHYGAGFDREFTYTIPGPSTPSYTNQIPIATDLNGEVYNGVGYKNGVKLNSSGNVTEYDGFTTTGFIPAVHNDIVRMKDVVFRKGQATSSNQRICFYDSSKTLISIATANSAAAVISAVFNGDTIESFQVPTTDAYSNVAYFRMCAETITDSSVITVNEEIS